MSELEKRRKRLADAVHDANLKFWEEIYKHYPEIPPGSLPHFLKEAQKSELRSAVAYWINVNQKED